MPFCSVVVLVLFSFLLMCLYTVLVVIKHNPITIFSALHELFLLCDLSVGT